MKLRIEPNVTSFGFNQFNMFITFEKKDYRQFRRDLRSSEETVQCAQFTDEHLWQMWAERKNYHVHSILRQYYDKTSTQILINLEDEWYNDKRMISINTFVHSSDNHDMFCKDCGCTIYQWLLNECYNFD